MKKTLKEVNKDIQKYLTDEPFEQRVSKLLKLGLVEIIDVQEDGSPIVNVTEKGLQLALDELQKKEN